MPLSVALLAGAVGIPKLWPKASPRRVVRVGFLLMLAGISVLMSGLELDASAAIVAMPMVLIGLGIGALASQLGAVTVSAVPTSETGDVGGLQNTATNLGASLGTALAGSVLIAVLTASVISGITANPDVPDAVQQTATVEMASGVPFLSDTDLEAALDDADVPPELAASVLDVNREARVEGLKTALGFLLLIAAASLFFTGRIPKEPVGAESIGTAPLVPASTEPS